VAEMPVWSQSGPVSQKRSAFGASVLTQLLMGF
jgi:hypothetical protein